MQQLFWALCSKDKQMKFLFAFSTASKNSNITKNYVFVVAKNANVWQQECKNAPENSGIKNH